MPFMDDFDEPYITTEEDLDDILYGKLDSNDDE